MEKRVSKKTRIDFRLVKKISSTIISLILFISLVFTSLLVISTKASGGEPQVFGHQIKTVLSGSMDPTFKTGSIIAVKPIEDATELKKGDIITYRQDQQTIVTHRIIEVLGSGNSLQFRTKGDNNEDPDMNGVLASNVVAEYSGFTIPYVGYLVDFARTKMGGALLLIVPGILLLIYSGITIWKAIGQIEVRRPSKEEQADKTV